ncbi:MAG TPA: hypothetical protein DEB17_02570 [Chlorobaculum sp.]|uniref:Uncharacterized protein n=1 Tax=Chlorobaculum tepidum (strain ATCC 49652 / DSM 12025 / NBRC 103806 / TLS) TaxID=194439 RepID=Q8KEG6_CHLTE|nr:hypothetical protein CT0723 [Chlorobaculum tepidum TLS]HBU22880.1 hypothetical protein [Chlorobaculum sp.]
MDTVPKALLRELSPELAERFPVSRLSLRDIHLHEKTASANRRTPAVLVVRLTKNRKGNYVTFKVLLYLGISFRRPSGQGGRSDFRRRAG